MATLDHCGAFVGKPLKYDCEVISELGIVAPVGPTRPAGPVSPVVPLEPVEPVGPIGPVCPVEPVEPVYPVGPVFPVGPPSIREASSEVPLGPNSKSRAVKVPNGRLRLPGSDEFRLVPKKTLQLVVLTMPTPAPEA